MPVAFVNSATSQANTTPVYALNRALSFGTVGAGNTLVVAISTNAASTVPINVADSKGQTWTKAVDILGTDPNTKRLLVFYTTNVAAGATSVTASTGGNANYVSWAISGHQYSGVASTAALDLTVTKFDDAYFPTHDVASTTATAQADELLMVAYSSAFDSSTTPAPLFSASGFTAQTTCIGQTVGADRPYASVFLAARVLTEVSTPRATVTTTKTTAGNTNTSGEALPDKGALALLSFKGAAPVTTVPGVPSNFLVYGADKSVSLMWSAPANATSYRVYRSATSGGTYTQIAAPTDTTYTDTGLTNGTTYYYKVAAVNSVGTGSQTASVSATPAVPPPATTYQWHPYGTQPNLTVAQLRAMFKTVHDKWMAYTLTTDGTVANPRLPGPVMRIKAPDQGFYPEPNRLNTTVSEGIGYGILFYAIRSNPALTDLYDPTAKGKAEALYRYYDYNKNVRGFMNWHINEDQSIGDVNGATDGDEDVAEGLRQLSVLHGDAGVINFGLEAQNLINAIQDYQFVPETGYQFPNIMTNGDGWGFNTDSYMPDYMRAAFWRQWSKWLRARGLTARAERWLRILKVNYDHNEYYFTNNSAGVPDRQTRTYGTIDGEFNNKVTYNSVRLFFGIGLEYLWFGPEADSRALAFTNKVGNRLKTVFGTGSNVKAPAYNKDLTEYQGYSNATGYGYALSAVLADPNLKTFATEIANAGSVSTDPSTNYFNGGIICYAFAMASGALQPLGTGTTVTPTLPGTISSLTSSNNTQTVVNLAWTAATAATGYVVERASTSGGTYSAVYTGANLSYQDTGRTAGTTYFYRVRGTNSAGDGANSAVLSATTAPVAQAIPGQVVNVVTGTLTSTTVSLSWASTANAVTYQVERATASNGTYTQIANTSTTAFTDANLAPATTYYYRVRGVNPDAVGTYSAILSATTQSPTPSVTQGRYRVYDGGAFVPKPVKVWDGTQWVQRVVKRYDGTEWKPIN